MAGFASRPSPADCTPIWFREVDLIGSHGYGIEQGQGRKVHSFELVVEWMRQGKLPVQGLITHRHALVDYKQAIRAANGKSASKATKVVLEMGNS
jgi:threonine dehydrogenase-like Zn-dependent dehydrogenase